MPELKEGWYDSSLWCHIIDALCARSIYVTVLRKEIQIIPRGSTDRFDGVFRWMNGMNERFDLGVIEVGSMSQLPNSDSKPATDRAKIIRGMATLLTEARKHKHNPKLQVIGILCSGWSITLFRMWHNGVGCVVEDRKYTIWTMDEHQARNLDVFKVVVQSLVCWDFFTRRSECVADYLLGNSNAECVDINGAVNPGMEYYFL